LQAAAQKAKEAARPLLRVKFPEADYLAGNSSIRMAANSAMVVSG